MQYGLTQLEAEKFVSLVQILEIPEEDIQDFDSELDSVDPFAGQLTDAEAIIAVRKALEWEDLMTGAFTGSDNEEE